MVVSDSRHVDVLRKADEPCPVEDQMSRSVDIPVEEPQLEVTAQAYLFREAGDRRRRKGKIGISHRFIGAPVSVDQPLFGFLLRDPDLGDRHDGVPFFLPEISARFSLMSEPSFSRRSLAPYSRGIPILDPLSDGFILTAAGMSPFSSSSLPRYFLLFA